MSASSSSLDFLFPAALDDDEDNEPLPVPDAIAFRIAPALFSRDFSLQPEQWLGKVFFLARGVGVCQISGDGAMALGTFWPKDNIRRRDLAVTVVTSVTDAISPITHPLVLMVESQDIETTTTISEYVINPLKSAI